MIDSTQGFTLVRMVDAPPASIWRAWTSADEIAEWWHPAGASTMREIPTGGAYRELVQNEKLVFTWGEPDDDPDDAPLVTVTIEDLGELTRLTLDLRGVDGMKGDSSFYDGWESALDSLAAHLGQAGIRG